MNNTNLFKEKLDRFVDRPSKEKARDFALNISNNTSFIEYVLNEGLQNNGRYSRYAIWIIDKLNLIDKGIIKPYHEKIIDFIPLCKDQTQLGIMLRLPLRGAISLEVENLGILIDFCTEILRNPKPPQYHKSYSLQILEKICSLEPVFKEEIYLLIEDIYPHFTASYMKGLSKRIMKKLSS